MADVTVKVYKSWNTDDNERAWANTYEFTGYEGALDVGNVQFGELVSAIVEAEREIHLTNVYFLRAVVSTWGVDADEGAPENFVSFPIALQGTRTATGDPIDRNNVFFVRRAAGFGRYGKIFYRGCLVEADVQSGADLKWRLTPTSSLATGGADWTAYLNSMQAVMSDGFGGQPAQMALISARGLTITRRLVTSLTPAGVRVNKANHKYFDRSN